jgi:phage portal protein BeeE
VPADDVHFLETIKASATEIAAIYRVQPEDIGGVSGGSLTYATLEMNELKRNRRALMPWVRRMEWATTGLLPQPQYVKANMDHLARADLKTRMEAHDIALRIGLETLPEGRALEDKAPLTPDEINEWQNMYGSRKGQPVATSTTEGQA